MSSEKRPILLVEDEFLIAIDVQMRLQEAGYAVLNPVGSVEEALAILDAQPVGAAILDMTHPKKTAQPGPQPRPQGRPQCTFKSHFCDPEHALRSAASGKTRTFVARPFLSLSSTT